MADIKPMGTGVRQVTQENIAEVWATLKGGETFQLLVPEEAAGNLIRGWLHNAETCNIGVRKAKTAGHLVMETKDRKFAESVVVWCGEVKVVIKR